MISCGKNETLRDNLRPLCRPLQNVGVSRMTSVLASAEAYKEVGGGLSMSHFFRKIS